MYSAGKPTLRCSILSLFIEPQKKPRTGQIDPHFSRTFRLHGQRLVLLSEYDKEILLMWSDPTKNCQSSYSVNQQVFRISYLNTAFRVLHVKFCVSSYTHSFRYIYSKKYLHSSLVITQVKGAVADPEVRMLLFLANTSLKLEMTQQHISSRAAALSNAVLSVA